VQFSVAAHDSKGNAVTDLKQEDFQVFDNGKEQEIAEFSAERAASAQPVALGAPAGDNTQPADKPGGYAVILLDYLNSGHDPATRARGEIAQFLKDFDPQGRLALYVLDDHGVRAVGDFGTDRDAMLKAMDSVTGAPSPCSDNGSVGADGPCESGLVEQLWIDREYKSLGALDAFADRLSFLAGRKALVWVSTSTNVQAQLARANDAHATPYLDAEKERVMEKLNNADVALYPIDACGLGTGCQSHFEAMDDFAARTGGVATHGVNRLDIDMRRAVEDIQFSYSLAFYPSDEGARADFHKLKVEVKRPGVKVEYKQGYSLDSPATAIAASLAEPAPGADLRASALASIEAAPPAVALAAGSPGPKYQVPRRLRPK